MFAGKPEKALRISVFLVGEIDEKDVP